MMRCLVFLLMASGVPLFAAVTASVARVVVDRCPKNVFGEDFKECFPVSQLMPQVGVPFDLQVRVHQAVDLPSGGLPLAGKLVSLQMLTHDEDGGETVSTSLLAKWRGSLTETTDADGVALFHGLFLREEYKNARIVAVVAEKDSLPGEYLGKAHVDLLRAPTKVVAIDYKVYEMYPPISEWSVYLDGDIPAGASVFWYLKEGDSIGAMTEWFRASENTNKITIRKEAFSCSYYRENYRGHELYLSIVTRNLPSGGIFASGIVTGLGGCKDEEYPPAP